MNPRAMSRVILVHYAEIGLKGGNRVRFTRRLADRLRQALESAGVDAGVRVESSRLVATPREGQDFDQALRAVLRVPGVANAAVAVQVDAEMEAMKQAAADQLAVAPAGSFKVEVRRADKRFPGTSIDIARAVGGRCAAVSRRDVDVHTPDVTVRVEVIPGSAFISAGSLPGPGGGFPWGQCVG